MHSWPIPRVFLAYAGNHFGALPVRSRWLFEHGVATGRHPCCGPILSALTKVAGDLERLAANAQRAQTDVERLADGVNKANLERAALRKQVESNAEWIESINAFRRQVNASIAELEADLATLNSPVLQ